MAEDPALRVLQMRRPTAEGTMSGPRTYPGRLAEEDSIGLEKHLATARKKLADLEAAGCVLLLLDPTKVRRSAQANRHSLSLQSTDPAFVELKTSLRRDGQILPIVVRAIDGDSLHSHELVSGHRRHEAALQLATENADGFKLRAVLDTQASDPAKLALHMYLENAARKDLSAFETGSMFLQWLKAGVCKTQQDIAALTGLDKSTVSQYITIAELRSEVLEAFGDVRDIALRWSKALASSCKEAGPQTVARAKKLALANPRPSAEAVFRALTSPVASQPAKRRGSKVSDTVMVNDKVLFKIALKDGRYTINPRQIAADQRQALYEDLKAFADKWLKSHHKDKG